MRGPALTLLLVSSLTVMSGATIAASLPALQAHFSDTPGAALLSRLVLTVPAAAIVVSAPLAGLLADRIGRRSLLVVSILLFSVAGASGLVLESLPALLVGRAALGLAVGAIMTVAGALAGDYFAGPQRQVFMGRQGAFTGIGGLVFITGGGFLAGLHWRAPFAIYGLALLLIPLVIAHLRNPPASDGAEPSCAAPVVPTAVRRDLVMLLYAAAVFNSVAFYLIPTQLPFLLEARGNTSPFLTGLAIGVATIVSVAASLNFRRASARMSPPSLLAIGFGLMGLSYALVASYSSFTAVLAAMAIAGAGLGLMIPNLTSTALELAPAASRGAVMGGLTAAIFLGQFLSPFVSQPWAGAYGLPSAFGAMAVALVAVAALLFLHRASRRRLLTSQGRG